MKLSDVMGAMGLAVYAEIALVFFLAAFIAVVCWVYARGNRGRWEDARHMPLDDGIEARPAGAEAPVGGQAR